MTIKELLQKSVKILVAKNISSASLDAEILLLHVLAKSKNKPKLFNRDRAWLYAHSDYDLAPKQEALFLKLIARRALFEPIAYIVNKKEFFGLDFFINKDVLIPRPETEILVENALKEILENLKSDKNKKIVIADIGTGSGAIAISIAKILKDQNHLKQTTIFATDISAPALKIARKNAKNHNCDKNIIFKKGNLLQALPKNTKINFLLANLPYVGNDYYYQWQWLKNGGAPSEFHEIKHEPKISLLAKKNGLEYYNNFFPALSEYLAKNAKIFLESDPFQIPAIKKLAKKHLPKHRITVIKDLRGLKRITKIELK